MHRLVRGQTKFVRDSKQTKTRWITMKSQLLQIAAVTVATIIAATDIHANVAETATSKLSGRQREKDLKALVVRRKDLDLSSVELSPGINEKLTRIVHEAAFACRDGEKLWRQLERLAPREAALILVERLLTVEVPLSGDLNTIEIAGKRIAELSRESRTSPLVVQQMGWLLFNSPADQMRDLILISAFGELDNRSYLLQIARYHKDERCVAAAIGQLSKNAPKLAEWLREDRKSFLERVLTIQSSLKQRARLEASLSEAFYALEDRDKQLIRFEAEVTALQKSLDEEKRRGDLLAEDVRKAKADAEATARRLEEERNRDIVIADGRRYRLRQLVGDVTANNGKTGAEVTLAGRVNVPVICIIPDVNRRNESLDFHSLRDNVRAYVLGHGKILPKDDANGTIRVRGNNVRVQFFEVDAPEGAAYTNYTPEWLAYVKRKQEEAERRSERAMRSRL
jgi:hypothetical protein